MQPAMALLLHRAAGHARALRGKDARAEGTSRKAGRSDGFRSLEEKPRSLSRMRRRRQSTPRAADDRERWRDPGGIERIGVRPARWPPYRIQGHPCRDGKSKKL